MKITLRQLEVFVEVAARGHFGQAAQALHIAQPTVSQEIARLERSLEATLFDRSRRQATLTPAGQTLLSGAGTLLADLDSLVRDVQGRERDLTGHVDLIASPSVENLLLPRLIAIAELRLPGLTIDDKTVETGSVSKRIATDQSDVGLGRFLDDIPGYRRETIAHEPVHVMIGRSHPLAGTRQPIALSDLQETPLLSWPRDQHPHYYDYVVAVCHAHGLDPMVLLGPARIVGSRQFLLTEGRAFSLVPWSATRALPDGLIALRVAGDPTLPLEMQWRTDDTRHSVVALRAEIRRLAAIELAGLTPHGSASVGDAYTPHRRDPEEHQ